MDSKGKLIIFSAPSGAGKTTLVRYVMSRLDDMAFSVSACSRPRREGEVDGRDYYFLTVDEFRSKIDQQAFVEWEEVYPGHYYGTLISEVERQRKLHRHIVFDVDVKGGLNIKRKYGEEALAIFIRPPSLEVLAQRLHDRATDSEEKISMRLAKATAEMGYENSFDVTIINDDLKKARSEAYHIVKDFIDRKA